MAKRTRASAGLRDAFALEEGPEMRSGRAPLSKFISYPGNPRTHPPAEIVLLSRILKESGPDQPIVVDENFVIIKGHGRLEAAGQAGLNDFPYVQRRGLSEEDKRAMRIQDNQVALLAGWDRDLIRAEIVHLQGQGYEVSLLGFEQPELIQFLHSTIGNVDPEATPEIPSKPVALKGDLWTLGRHRLLCGDATSAEDVRKVLGKISPHLMVTDPPYGVNYDPDWRNRADRANGKLDGARAIGLVTNDERSDWSEAWQLFPG